MENKKYYLKQNVQLEPLFNQWYAWSHLISPATAAMNIAYSHLNIMRSYVSAPGIHAAAVKNPSMRGGPFIDCDGDKVNEIKALIEKTTREQSLLIEFAKSIKQCDEMLMDEAKGYSLEPLYQKVPQILRGYIELVYDLNNNPSMRFIEALLYKSSFYNESLQSIRLSLVNSDNRPFVFSTPRLVDDQHLFLNIPFRYECIDELSKMKTVPQSLSYIKERLGFSDEYDQLFKTFLTEEEPEKYSKYDGETVRTRYFGHACILIESKDISILIDPLISYKYESEIYRYTYLDLPNVIDYVLITHNHADHLMLETLLQIRHKIKTIIVPRSADGALQDPSLKLILQNCGFRNIIEINEMETIEVEGGTLTGLPFFGEHSDLNIKTKIAHLICLKGTSFLCAADSNNIEPKLYEHLSKSIGNIDVLFLGMECDGAPLTWLYGPLLTKPLIRKMDQSRRLSGSNCERGINIINQFNFKRVYVYAMGQEPWLNYITSIKYTEESRPIIESDKLVEECRRQGITSERLFGTKELN